MMVRATRGPRSFHITPNWAMQGRKRVRVDRGHHQLGRGQKPGVGQVVEAGGAVIPPEEAVEEDDAASAGSPMAASTGSNTPVSSSKRPVRRPSQMRTLARRKMGRTSRKYHCIRAAVFTSTFFPRGQRMGGMWLKKRGGFPGMSRATRGTRR